MIKFENTEVMGWEHAIRGMRNPMNSWSRIDSEYCCSGLCGDGGCIGCGQVNYYIGTNDYKLMMNLAKSGPVHGKYRRMITVYVDITAPLYWWKEFDTYKVGTVANSCSTMHKIHAKKFTLEDFSCEHLTKRSLIKLQNDINELNFWRDAFSLKTMEDRASYFASRDWSDTYIPARKECWWQIIQLLPSSYNQKRTVMLNYEVLAHIYQDRKDHKLDEWAEHKPDWELDTAKPWQFGFCDWIKTLPYSELITVEEK